MDTSIQRKHPTTGNGDAPPKRPNRVPTVPQDDVPVDAPVDAPVEPQK